MNAKGVWDGIKDVKVGGYPAQNVIIVGAIAVVIVVVAVVAGFYEVEEPIDA